MAAARILNALDSKYVQESSINYSKSFLLGYWIISEIFQLPEVLKFLQMEYI